MFKSVKYCTIFFIFEDDTFDNFRIEIRKNPLGKIVLQTFKFSVRLKVWNDWNKICIGRLGIVELHYFINTRVNKQNEMHKARICIGDIVMNRLRIFMHLKFELQKCETK